MPTPPRPGGLVGLLAALRSRLRVALAAVALAFALAFAFAEQIADVLARPLHEAWARRGVTEALGPIRLHFASLVEPFWTYMSLAFWVALVATSPLLFFQLWRVIAPRLRPDRRRLGVPFAAITGLCFVGGVVFAYLLVLPTAYDFLLSYAHGASTTGAVALRPALYLDPYITLTMRMLVAFGVVFELPVLLGLLTWLGAIGWRSLWRFNRWAIVLAFALAAVLTPGPDVVSQLLMAAPLVVLYNLSIALAWLIERRKRERAAG